MCILCTVVCIHVNAEEEEASLWPMRNYAGDLKVRDTLTGDWGGKRTEMEESGVNFDINLTTVGQSILDGGRDTNTQAGGSMDFGVNLDFDKLGLWPGAFLMIRGEGSFGNSINGDTGALIAANNDALYPVIGDNKITLTDFVFMQFLSEQFGIILGKMNTLDGDPNEFAHGANNDKFLNMAFAFNAATLRTTPYSALGAGFIYLPNENTEFTFMVLDTEGTAEDCGFDTVFDSGTTLSSELRTGYDWKGKPGHVLIGGTYSDKEVLDLRFILDGLELARKDDSWSIYGNFDQYLFVEKDDPTQGWGIFGRIGFADPDTSPIEAFYSFGIGGKGIIPNRDNDTFGVGYYYAQVSDDLPALLNLDDGQGFELFYNIEATPWLHITPDIQIIDSSIDRIDSAVVAGLRMKIDF